MDDVMGLIDRAHHGDERARAQLVEQNMGLVWSIVRRFSGRGRVNIFSKQTLSPRRKPSTSLSSTIIMGILYIPKNLFYKRFTSIRL